MPLRPRPRRAGRLPLGMLAFYGVAFVLSAYFALSAVQGPSGILKRVQIEAETAELAAERDRLQAEVDEMENRTRRLSDDYLDLDLLDERARAVLGMARADEAVLP